MSSNVGTVRQAIWEKNHFGPLDPFTQCFRYDLPVARFHKDVEQVVIIALEALDPCLEIVFDKFTATGSGPGHHLYRRSSRDGGNAYDSLQLEFSLMDDCGMVWGASPAREPGMWVVEEFKKRDLARLPGGKKAVTKESKERAVKRDEAMDREAAEGVVHLEKELQPFVQRAIDGNKGSAPRTSKRRKRAGDRTVTTYEGQKARR